MLMHLDLSRNSITDSGLPGSVSSAQQQQQQQQQLPGGPLLPHLAVLDLSYNKVAAEAAVTPLLQRLPGLQRLILAGNPLVRHLLLTHLTYCTQCNNPTPCRLSVLPKGMQHEDATRSALNP